MKEKEYYKILNIKEDATKKEIKEAYRLLEDKYFDDEKKLNEIEEAYHALLKKIKEENKGKTNDYLKNIKKEQIIIFISGLAVGLLTMIIFYPERIAELKNGEEIAIKVNKTNITSDDIYTNLKDNYAINSIIELIDKTILEKKYKLTEEDYNQIDKSATNTISQYESVYNITEEEFLKRNGFDSIEDFKKYLELDYMRSKFYKECMDKNISDEDIEKYYNESVHDKIKTEHILVRSSDTAKEKAEEILDKLKNGTSWEELKNQYKEEVVTEEVTVDFDSSLEETFKKAAVALKDGEYSNSLVETSYGYHIIYRVSSEKKGDKKTLETRIKNAIISEKEDEDKNLYEKVMIKMREDSKTEIKDTKLKEAYNKYLKQYE